MGLKKGQTNNRKGRPKGSENKVSMPMRELITSFVDGNMNKLQENYDTLEPRLQVKVIIDLLGFVMPKYAPISNNDESDEKKGNSYLSWIDKVKQDLDEVAREND
jgi:hypothetical protein